MTRSRGAISVGYVFMIAVLVTGAAAHSVYAGDGADELAILAEDDDGRDLAVIFGEHRAAKMFNEGAAVHDFTADWDTGAGFAGPWPLRQALNGFTRGSSPVHFLIGKSGGLVRGIPFVRSEINGRDAFSANGGHEIGFEDLAPPFLSTVEIFRSQSADMIEGGLSGTVNIVTQRPLNHEGDIVAASVGAHYTDLRDAAAPVLSALYSTRMQSGLGDFGILVSGKYEGLRSRTDGTYIPTYRSRSDIEAGREIFLPIGGGFYSEEGHEKARALAAVAQWQSPDGRLLLGVQAVHSDIGNDVMEVGMSTAFDGFADTYGPVAGTPYEIGEAGIFTRGTLAVLMPDSAASRTAAPPTFEHEVLKRNSAFDTLTTDYAVDLRWAPADNLRFYADGQYVTSRNTIYNVLSFLTTDATVSLDASGSIGVVSFSGPGGTPGDTFFADPAHYSWLGAVDIMEDSEATQKAVRADLEYDVNWGPITSVRTGGRLARREHTLRRTGGNFGFLSDVLGGNATALSAGDISAGYVKAFGFSGFMRGRIAVPSVPFHVAAVMTDHKNDPARIFPSIAANPNVETWVPLGLRDGLVPGMLFRLPELAEITEATEALYAMASFEHNGLDLFGMPFDIKGNAGLRYVRTDITTSGTIQMGGAGTQASDTCRGSAENAYARYFSSACGMFAASDDNDYESWLPSAYLEARSGEALTLRAAASRAILRPGPWALRNHLQISNVFSSNASLQGGALAHLGVTGNPALAPVEAVLVDLGGDWKFADEGTLALTLFYKELDGYPLPRTELVETNDTEGPVLELTQPYNTQDVSVKGFQILYEQTYSFLSAPFGNLGLLASYTYTDYDGPDERGLHAGKLKGVGGLPVIDPAILPLEDVSKHFLNVSATYKRDWFMARLGYSWRSRYLVTPRFFMFPFNPILGAATDGLEGSLAFDLDDTFKLSVSAANILDETERTLHFLDDYGLTAPGSWTKTDRRVTVALSAQWQ